MLRQSPTEEGRAYLLGVLTHYCLDSICHEVIHVLTKQENLQHMELETEFERYLLELDGKKPPYLQDLSGHMQLTPGQCQTVAVFYPNVSAGAVGKCVENMASVTKFLVMPKGPRRDLAEKTLKLTVPKYAGHLMTVHPNRDCMELNPSLLRLYEMAMDRYPVLLDQIQAHLRSSAPLGTDFSVIFG